MDGRPTADIIHRCGPCRAKKGAEVYRSVGKSLDPIVKIASNPYGRKLLWPWLKKNWKPLVKKFGLGNPLANRIVASISLVADSKMEKEIRQFFKKNPTPGTEMTLEQTLERIRVHSKFLQEISSEFRN